MGRTDRSIPFRREREQRDQVREQERELAEWRYFRTCSRVSGGPCDECGKETFFGYVTRGSGKARQIRCRDCHLKITQPEAWAREQEDVRKSREAYDKARDGDCVGYIAGIPLHKRTEGLYDTKSFGDP